MEMMAAWWSAPAARVQRLPPTFISGWITRGRMRHILTNTINDENLMKNTGHLLRPLSALLISFCLFLISSSSSVEMRPLPFPLPPSPDRRHWQYFCYWKAIDDTTHNEDKETGTTVNDKPLVDNSRGEATNEPTRGKWLQKRNKKN